MKYGWILIAASMILFEVFVGSQVGQAFGKIDQNLFGKVQQALDSQKR